MGTRPQPELFNLHSQVTHMLRAVKAVNRGAGQTGYIILGLTTPKELHSALSAFEKEGLDSEVTYWNQTESKQSGVLLLLLLHVCID